MATVNVRMTGERLAAMDDNDMAIYCTPGASDVYWSNRPNFMYDKCVGTVRDFLDAVGYDELDESDMDEIFDLDVALVEAR
jgi:hypothetical protein